MNIQIKSLPFIEKPQIDKIRPTLLITCGLNRKMEIKDRLARNFIWSSEQHQPWSWLELCASRVLILISTLRDNPHVAYDSKLLFQVRFFDGSKLIKNKVGGLFFLSWFNLMRFKITFSPPCYSFKVLEFADRHTGEREWRFVHQQKRWQVFKLWGDFGPSIIITAEKTSRKCKLGFWSYFEKFSRIFKWFFLWKNPFCLYLLGLEKVANQVGHWRKQSLGTR